MLKEKWWNSLFTLGQEGLYYIPPLLVLDPYLINGILMLGVDSVTSEVHSDSVPWLVHHLPNSFHILTCPRLPLVLNS